MLLENGSQGKQAKKYIENIKEDVELRNIQFKDRTAWRQLISSTVVMTDEKRRRRG